MSSSLPNSLETLTFSTQQDFTQKYRSENSSKCDFGVNSFKSEIKFDIVNKNVENIFEDNNNEFKMSSSEFHEQDHNIEFENRSETSCIVSEEFIDESVSESYRFGLESTTRPSQTQDNDYLCKSYDVVDEKFIRNLLEAAYKQDEKEISKNAWKPCAISSPNRKKILIRELSYDELKDMKGVDLMAPVFLAVTDEGADNLKDLKRASKSIEDLCSTTLENEDGYFKKKIKPTQEILKSSEMVSKSLPIISWDGEYKASCRKSSDEISDYENSISHPKGSESVVSDIYNESIDDSLEDQAFIDVLVNHTSFDDDNISGVTYRSISSLDEEKSIDKGCSEEQQGTGQVAAKSRSLDDPASPSLKLEKLCMENGISYYSKLVMLNPENKTSFWEYPSERSQNGEKTLDTSTNTSANTSPESALNIRCKRFVVVSVDGQHRIVDLQLIEPYFKVITHGGHHLVGDEKRVIIVINAYHLPKNNVEKYRIIMEQLFYYCIHAVSLLVINTYEIVFFNSNVSAEQRPNRDWIKNVYCVIQYRLRKQLKKVYFVHPSMWLKAMIKFCSLFVSSKFMKKIRIVKNLQMLRKYVPKEYIFVAPEIHKIDELFR